MPDEPGAYLAIDIGGTKIACGTVDTAGELATVHRIATPQGTDAEELLGAVVQLARAVRADAAGPLIACGVGCGGPMEADTVSPLNIPAWREFPLRARLAEEFALTVAVDNDAKALALAEGWRGAAKGSANYLAMVVSTGVGGGIVLDGRLLDGRLGNAGHVGHVNVVADGRVCSCGARGCLEAEASGTAIRVQTGAEPETAPRSVQERCGTMVGRAVASVANLLDLELAVVGGSVALGYGDTFFAAARVELAERARLAFSRKCRIEPVGLGASAPLVGAAAVAIRHLAATGEGPR